MRGHWYNLFVPWVMVCPCVCYANGIKLEEFKWHTCATAVSQEWLFV